LSPVLESKRPAHHRAAKAKRFTAQFSAQPFRSVVTLSGPDALFACTARRIALRRICIVPDTILCMTGCFAFYG